MAHRVKSGSKIGISTGYTLRAASGATVTRDVHRQESPPVAYLIRRDFDAIVDGIATVADG